MKKTAKKKIFQEKANVNNQPAKPCCGSWAENNSRDTCCKHEAAPKGACRQNKH